MNSKQVLIDDSVQHLPSPLVIVPCMSVYRIATLHGESEFERSGHHHRIAREQRDFLRGWNNHDFVILVRHDNRHRLEAARDHIHHRSGCRTDIFKLWNGLDLDRHLIGLESTDIIFDTAIWIFTVLSKRSGSS